MILFLEKLECNFIAHINYTPVCVTVWWGVGVSCTKCAHGSWTGILHKHTLSFQLF